MGTAVSTTAPAVAFALALAPATAADALQPAVACALRQTLAAATGVVVDRVLLASIVSYPSGASVMVADDDTVNTVCNLMGGEGAWSDAITGGGSSSSGSGTRLRRGLHQQQQVSGAPRPPPRRALSVTTLVAPTPAASLSSNGSPALSLGWNIATLNATQAAAIKALLTGSSLGALAAGNPAMATSLSAAWAALDAARGTNGTYSIALSPSSVAIVSLTYRRTSWSVLLAWLLRNVANVAGGAAFLFILIFALCVAKPLVSRRAAARKRAARKAAAARLPALRTSIHRAIVAARFRKWVRSVVVLLRWGRLEDAIGSAGLAMARPVGLAPVYGAAAASARRARAALAYSARSPEDFTPANASSPLSPSLRRRSGSGSSPPPLPLHSSPPPHGGVGGEQEGDGGGGSPLPPPPTSPPPSWLSESTQRMADIMARSQAVKAAARSVREAAARALQNPAASHHGRFLAPAAAGGLPVHTPAHYETDSALPYAGINHHSPPTIRVVAAESGGGGGGQVQVLVSSRRNSVTLGAAGAAVAEGGGGGSGAVAALARAAAGQPPPSAAASYSTLSRRSGGPLRGNQPPLRALGPEAKRRMAATSRIYGQPSVRLSGGGAAVLQGRAASRETAFPDLES